MLYRPGNLVALKQTLTPNKRATKPGNAKSDLQIEDIPKWFLCSTFCLWPLWQHFSIPRIKARSPSRHDQLPWIWTPCRPGPKRIETRQRVKEIIEIWKCWKLLSNRRYSQMFFFGGGGSSEQLKKEDWPSQEISDNIIGMTMSIGFRLQTMADTRQTGKKTWKC